MLLWVVIAVAVGWLVLRSLRGRPRARIVEGPAPADAPVRRDAHPGRGTYPVAVVGESHYQRQLRAVCGPGEVKFKCTAYLLLENDNQFDSNAVAVNIGGKRGGYLDREMAIIYRQQVEPLGGAAVDCDALIIGGGPGKPSVDVWLDIPDYVNEL